MTSTRKAAIDGGSITYAGRACRHGHGMLRYTSSGACVVCAKAQSASRGGYYRERYMKDRDRILAQMRGRYVANPEPCKRRNKRWVARNIVRVRAIKRRYKAVRRSREERGIDGSIFASWAAVQPKVCFYCGSECSGTFHVDHFMPLARGGAHVLTNLRIACASCNLHKSSRDPRAWIDSVTPEMVMP